MPIELAVASAIIFGPLSSWLARRAGRSTIGWLILGALIGPLAPALLLFAPPAFCPVCEAPSDGFARACPACGYRYRSVLLGEPDEVPEPDATPVPDVTPAPDAPRAAAPPEHEPAAPATAPAQTAPPVAALAAVGAPPEPTVAAPMAVADPDAVPNGDTLISTGLEQAATVPREPDRSTMGDREILAYGVYVTGTARMPIGSRYAIAIQGPDLVVQGPLDVDPLGIAARYPRETLDASHVNDRLLISDSSSGRVSFALSFMAVGVAPGRDIASLRLRSRTAPGHDGDAGDDPEARPTMAPEVDP
ncbi:MAG TPA: hypothetical protein VLA23_02950 [Candidatus Limnocylindrales bacterium]|nr:hypothetical protein [Candidatus Limnocylindrales bacterium]